jgi:diguanylate cyclase (GGDEF)-like protein/PAS domain S-box-containing protein
VPRTATEFVSGFESFLFPFRFPLAAVFNNISQGVCLFDASARVVAYNASYIELHGLTRDVVKPGCTLIELLQHRKETGLLIEDPEEYAQEILARVKKGQVTTRLIETGAGRFIRAEHHPIAGGGWVATHDDITDLRRAELAAEAARREAERAKTEAQAAHRRLLDAFDVVPEGLALFDAEDRLVLWNKRYAEFYARTTNIAAGVRFEELLRDGLEHGQYPDAIGREAEFLAQRLKLHNSSVSNMEQLLSESRWVRVEERRTADDGRIGVRIDVTDLKRREGSFRLLFEANPLPMLVYALDDFRFLAVNDAAVAHYGYSREQFLSLTAVDIGPPEDRDRFQRGIRSRAQLPSRGGTWRNLKADGTPIDAQVFSSPLSYQERPAVLAAILDVTERNRIDAQLREAREFLTSIVDNLPIGLTVKRASDRKYVLINKAGAQFLFDVPLDQQLGRTAEDIFPPDVAELINKYDAEALSKRGSEPTTAQFSFAHPGGFHLYQTTRLAFGGESTQEHILVLAEDVTDRIEAQARIAYLAHHDALTELPNRHTFELYLGAAVDRARAAGEPLAVVYIGLDHFKEVNDLFGTSVGDAVLCAVAERLADPAHDAFAARMGGDEFAVVCTGPQPVGAEQLTAKIFHSLGEELNIEGHTMQIAASMGVSIFPGDANTFADLIANADTAMERAKTEGRHSVRFFDRQTDRELRERRALHHDLRFALERDELRLEYQPLVKADRSVVGFEVLARWRHPVHGEVPPGKFIPMAEDGGLIFSIGRWILREACREAASWSEPLAISVNLSPTQVKQGTELVDLIRSTLEQTGLDPRRLELEITEGGLAADQERTVSILAELKSFGVRIAVDDFGTGYSSLSRLKDFPLDKIKIDRSFTSGIHLNPQSGSITQSIIALGHALGLIVLAEGVETEQQLAILTNESCDQMQGYLLGRPMPIEHYASLVRPEALDAPLAGAV